MVNIGSIIRRELANKETFYLPGLGMFKKEYRPAYFDEDEQLFIPPSHALLISNQKIDRNALTEFIAGNHNLSLSESKKVSSSIVDKLEDCISSKQKAYIEGLGDCFVNPQDELVIIPEEETSEFSLYDPIEEAEILPIRKQEKSLEALVAETSSEIETTNNTDNSETETVDEDTFEPIVLNNELDDSALEGDSKRWLWPVIGIAACIIIAGIWFLMPRGKEQPAINQPVATAQTENDQDSLSTLQGEDATALTVSDTSTVPDAVANNNPEEIIRKPSGRYEIIIAAFETMTEAKDFVNKTNAKGYNVYILQNNRPGNMNKISYATFNTSAEASESLSRVREELAKEAWLWENKNYNINNQN